MPIPKISAEGFMVLVHFFKVTGKYYETERVRFELATSDEAIMWRRYFRATLQKRLNGRMSDMVAVCMDTRPVGFPMMLNPSDGWPPAEIAMEEKPN